MGKVVVLAEKPSVGRDLARVLGCKENKRGCLEGREYVVTWALGHLVALADPEGYNPAFKTWRSEDLPILPDQLDLVVIRQTGKQFQTVKTQLRRGDVDKIVIATDAGREGELVARWIIEKAGVKKPVERLWISSVTDKAIREGFQRLKPGKLYENLYHSAAARAAADWYVGINATRALTCKYNAQLSCGRVQTPTLAMIERREREIQMFQSKPYYGISAFGNGVQWSWQNAKTNETRLFDRQQAEAVLRRLDGMKLEVVAVKKTAKKRYAPELYNLTDLQRDANRMYSFSAKETLSLMQRLYESHKVLTYPRTDSKYLTADLLPTLGDRLSACGVGPYAKWAFQAGKQLQAGKRLVDDAKVSDHHAIIPTEQYVNLTAMDHKERKIYDLVVKRFIAALYPPFSYEQATIEAEIGGERFIAQGKTVRDLGWKEIFQGTEDSKTEDDLKEQSLPILKEKTVFPAVKLSLTEGRTKPPAPFTEASLLSAMENPIKYLETADQALRKTLGEAGGIGTVATRADIIEKLFTGFLIEKRGRDLYITAKGRQLLNLVPEELKSPLLTAKWEQKLSCIADGKLGKDSFIGEIKLYAGEVVRQIKNSEDRFRHDNITRTRCPDCGKFMLEVNGKKGKMLICQDRECGHRKSLARVSNARCPNCHKKLELRGEGAAQMFVCPCGHREKLSVFKQRRAKEQENKVSKRDVTNYMKEQQKAAQQPVNTALADALAKLRLK